MTTEYAGKRRSASPSIHSDHPLFDSEPTWDDYLTTRSAEIQVRVKAYEATLRAHYELNPYIAEVYRSNAAAHEAEAEVIARNADNLEEALKGAAS